MKHEASNKQRWLILSQFFNCDGKAASHTITDKIPYLLHAGIDVTVISSKIGDRDLHLPHHQVGSLGPSGIRYDYRHLVAKRYGRGKRYKLQTITASILLTPFILLERILTGLSSLWSWAPVAGLKAWRLHRAQPFDRIYSTGGPVSSHLAGWIAHRLTGVAWVAEIHDPIVPARDEQFNLNDRHQNREQRLQCWLEKKVCTDAHAAWWFTEAAVASARKRNPQLGTKGFCVLPGAIAPTIQSHHQYTAFLNIAHFGSLSSTRSLHDFLLGLHRWTQMNPQAKSKVRLHVYGCEVDTHARQTADQLDVWQMIVCHGRLERDPSTGESGRDQVIRKMFECDALLLLHGEGAQCSEYIPSKFYEYLWARRPIFALTHLNPQFEQLVKQYGGMVVASTDTQAIANGLNQIWLQWNARSLETPTNEPISVGDAVQIILGRACKD